MTGPGVGDEDRPAVTVVFSDLKGSTKLGERLDAESLRGVLTRYFEEMQVVLESYGGSIEKIIGDAIVAVFGLADSDGNDPLRAVMAVAEAEQALAVLNDYLESAWGVRLVNRTGIATGEVIVGATTEGGRVLTGRAMEAAESLEGAAPDSGALMDDETLQLAEHIVVSEPGPSVPLAGYERSLVSHRLIGLRPGTIAERLREPDAEEPRPCPACGVVNPAKLRRCPDCDSLLDHSDDPTQTRRTVTIVFADPKPCWDEGTAATPAATEKIMTLYFERAHRVLEAHGATVEKFIGDAVMAVFGLPQRHEDDALRAVRAAHDMQQAVADLNRELREDMHVHFLNPMGVNTGRVVAADGRSGQRLVTGDAVNVAARLEQSAADHEVILGDLTRRLAGPAIEVEPIEPLVLKGKAQPVPAFRLVGPATDTRPHGGQPPMVGREVELARLYETFEDAGSHAACRLVTIVGEAGVGKTRLTEEFLEGIARVTTVLRGHCLSYGEGITFWPIAEILRDAADIKAEDPPGVGVAKLAAAVGDDEVDVTDRLSSIAGLVDRQFPVAESFWAVRRFLEILGRRRPLVLLLDNIHWGEPNFLELVEHLESEVRASPVMLLCTARGELLQRHPEWSAGPEQRRITLEALTSDDAVRIMENLLGDAAPDASVGRAVVQAAEGNPLYVEQVVSMLIEQGTLRLRGDRWEATEDLSGVAIPPSIDALLGARLDRLPADERTVIDTASVIGRRFPTPAVRELIDGRGGEVLARRLGSLEAKDFIEPVSPGTEHDDEIYGFRHLLVKDAAYHGLLKRTRADLHERFVAWADLVNRARGRELEFQEILGYHLEQAHLYWRELGPLDEHGVEVGRRAARRLSAAGERALARGDMPGAANLLGRSAALIPEGETGRALLLLKTGEALLEMGEFEPAGERFRAAGTEAAVAGDEAVQRTTEIELLRLRYDTDPEARSEEISDAAAPLIERLTSLGYPEGLARAWRLLATIELFAEQWGAAEQAARKMIEYARESGDEVMELRVLPALAGIARYGPTPVDDAIELCRSLLERTAGNRRAEMSTLLPMARLRAMRGEFDEARAVYRRARQTLADLGWRLDEALVSLDSGPIEVLAGSLEAAESELRRDLETLQAMGDTSYAATTAALLSEVLYRRKHLAEAAELAAFAEESAAEDDVAPQFLWRAVRAKILARSGRFGEAERLARTALDLALGSDDPSAQADVLTDLTEVLLLGGDRAAARANLEAAIQRYERKGNSMGRRRAERLMEILESNRTPDVTW